MPLPKPSTGETEDDFISRCMGNDTMTDEYPDSKQRSAVCYSQWRKDHGGDEPSERSWFTIRADAGGDGPEVYIYDEIGRGFFGGGVSASAFIDSVKKLKLKSRDELLVRINSPGGDVFDGIAIYNYLRGVKHQVRVRVDGVAASAASMIAMAGDVVEMPENSFLMIHNPWMMVVGDAAAMRKAASDLATIGEAAIAGYLRKSGSDLREAPKLEREKLVELLDAETWLSAQEAVSLGLADKVFEPVRAAALAKFEWKSLPFGRVPAALVEATSIHVDLAAERARLRRLGYAGPHGDSA